MNSSNQQVEINNLLHALNLDRVDIAELPNGATIACNITTLRKVAVFLKSLPRRESLDERRYSYLRSRDLNTINKGGVFAGMTPENVILNGEDLDFAIDNALSKIEGDKA